MELSSRGTLVVWNTGNESRRTQLARAYGHLPFFVVEVWIMQYGWKNRFRKVFTLIRATVDPWLCRQPKYPPFETFIVKNG